MRLIRFECREKTLVGAIRGDSYIELDSLMNASAAQNPEGGHGCRGSLRRFLEYCASPDAMQSLGQSMASLITDSRGDDLIRKASECRLQAPIHDPGKIICLGLNYADHAAEQGKEAPRSPIIFAKFPSCIIGPEEKIQLPSHYTQKVDYEVELAVVIGRRGKEIPENQAMLHIAGYTILNDVTARDFQSNDRQWVRGKSCDTFAPLGPYVVTADEIADPHNLQLELRLNGRVMQSSTTSQMVFKIPYLISYLSRCMTLEPGDIISTGTPPGVGVFRNPPVFLKDGDLLEATIEQIGTLRNPVAG